MPVVEEDECYWSASGWQMRRRGSALAWAPLAVSACSAGGPARLGLFDDLCYHDEIAGLKRNGLSGR
jgi:hypothetical protein